MNTTELPIRLYALRKFYLNAFYTDSYRPDPSLKDQIQLTEEGELVLKRVNTILKDNPDFEDWEKYFLVFLLFKREGNFLFDISKIDITTIEIALHNDITNGKIIFPWVYDKSIYDYYFEHYYTKEETVASVVAKEILANTPKGVFQLLNYIVGPFGLSHSASNRCLPPTTLAPLKHCPDPYCKKLHFSPLVNLNSQFFTTIFRLFNSNKRIGVLIKDYEEALTDIHSYYDDPNQSTLPWTLASAFSTEEYSSFMVPFFERYSYLRNIFPKSRNATRSSPKQLADGLSKQEGFQLLLQLEDIQVIELLEKAIEDSIIDIPTTEIRRPNIHPHSIFGCYRQIWECSRFGFRAIPINGNQNIATPRLIHYIKSVFSSQSNIEKLHWQLRDLQNLEISARIESYVYATEPKDIVKNLFFSDKFILQDLLKHIRFISQELPSNAEEEFILINKILWKTGFNIFLYPNTLKTFWSWHSKLLEKARSTDSYNTTDREELRSIATNFFVNLEQILDNGLSYITWALLSDHYKNNTFAFNLETARSFMARIINSEKYTLNNSSQSTLTILPNREDTLYPLSQSFACISKICERILTNEESSHLRDSDQLPSFAKFSSMFNFPYFHTCFLLDIERNDVIKVIEFLNSITSSFESYNICTLRNIFSHSRSPKDFPTQLQIEKACNEVARIVNIMEMSGIFPMVFFYNNTQTDQHQRLRFSFQDYKKRVACLYRPSLHETKIDLHPQKPLIITTWLRYKNSIEPIHFDFHESSQYFIYWRDYPKKRGLVSALQEKQLANTSTFDQLILDQTLLN